MNQIEQLIEKMKSEKSKAIGMYEEYINDPKKIVVSQFYLGHLLAFDFCISEAEFLLNAKDGTNGQEDTKNDGNAV